MDLRDSAKILEPNGVKKGDSRNFTRITENTPEMIERRKEQRIIWPLVIILILGNIYFFYCLPFLPYHRWETLLWCFLLYNVGTVGHLAGAHRLWSHRSYTATMPLKIILMFFYSIQGVITVTIYDWARDHRVHHRYTETDMDPYSAERGFFYSHVGWLLVTRHPDCDKKLREINIEDILKDPVVRFEKRFHYPLFILMCWVMPVLVPVMCWDESWEMACHINIVRWGIGLHSLGTINSLAHLFGSKPYNKNIYAAQNWFVSLMATGEGWHNYHHMFPWDYRASDFGFLNTSMHFITFCGLVGLARDLKTANPELVKSVMLKYGDGSHPDWVPSGPEIPAEALDDPEFVLPNPTFKKHS